MPTAQSPAGRALMIGFLTVLPASARMLPAHLLTGLDLGASFTDVPGGSANWTFSKGAVSTMTSLAA